MILFITNRNDITSDYLINKLNKRNIDYYRLNTDDLISNVQVNFDFDKEEFNIIDNKKEKNINVKEVKSVYYRRPRLPNIESLSLSKSELNFVLNEITFLLEGLYKILRNRFWISPVFSIREAENKIYQLMMAKELGFKIPSSLISTNENEAKSFIARNDYDCIVKSIKSGFIADSDNPKIIFTSRLGKEQLGSLARINKCPTYFQERIEKKADIRATIVGEKVFAAKINSQLLEETKTDWRKGPSHELSYENFELGEEFLIKSVNLVKLLGLNFGAIDFILDKKGDLTFLEINPNGQWVWIEERLGLNISEELIKLLVEGEYNQ